MLERHCFHSGLLSFLFVFIVFGKLQAASICELQFTECPEKFNNDTIVVPESVVAVSSAIEACATAINSPGGTSGPPPSIMFVIDHSGSMTGAGSSPNDAMGSRFTVTKALLDSIYKVQPNAEVGLAIFAGHLYFDRTSAQYFTSYFSSLPQVYDSEPDQAYLRLLKLNDSYGGRNGIDIIKDVLITEMVEGSNNDYIDLVYKPNFDPSLYTNINIGFLAAKHAMSNAVNPPERQFVIFLSDGEPLGNDQADLPANHFMDGENMPTTFTVYFTTNSSAPQSLVTMTENISNNGYSSSNPQSDLWAIQTSHSALLTLLMENVFDDILISGDPRRMVVNGIQTETFVDNSFVFPDRFPLKADITSYNTITSYSYTDSQTGAVRDTSVVVNFYIQRSSSAGQLPSGITLSCWQQPDLQFLYDGSPILVINEDMKQVQIQLDPNEETITSATVSISSSLETESFSLSQSGQMWSSQINRATSTSALIGDKIVQNIQGDSLIAFYRNPKIPLDTVRIAIPIIDAEGPEIQRAIYYPGTNGARDTVLVLFNEPVNSDRLTNAIPGVSFVYTDSGVVNNSKFNGSTYTGTYNASYTQEVRFLVEPGSVVPLVDSLSLVGLSASVSDQAGNNPSLDNPKVAIEWGTDNSITVATSTNPFIPGKTEIPPIIRQQYQDVIGEQNISGIIVGISSLKPLKKRNDSYGEVKIYDAVGNIVASGIKTGEGTTSGEYGIYWDGRNKNKRIVGGGTYLMVINLTDLDGKNTVYKVKIGIKR